MLIVFSLGRAGRPGNGKGTGRKDVKGGLTAYGIRKAIEEVTGERKSFGAIYPALKRLEEKGIVESDNEGNRRVYRLSRKGMESVRQLRKKKALFLKRMEELAKAMSEMFGMPDMDIARIFSPSFRFHAEMMKLASLLSAVDGKNVAKAREVLEQAIRKIRELDGSREAGGVRSGKS